MKFIIGLWLAGWWSFLICFDAALLWDFFQSNITFRYARTAGVIIKSEVLAHRDHADEGTSYQFQPTYTYQVGGQQHQASSYAAVDFSSSRAYHRRLQILHPVGAKVDVWYDPGRPEVAVLRRGVQPHWYLGVLFLVPFHVVGIEIYRGFFRRNQPQRELAGFLRLETPSATIVRFKQFRPSDYALIAAAVLAMISFPVMEVLWPVRWLNSAVVVGLFGLILAAAGAIAHWQWKREQRGDWDLVINHHRHTFTLPPKIVGRQPRSPEISFDNLLGIKVDSRKSTDSEATARHVAVLQYLHDGLPRVVDLTSSADLRVTERIVADLAKLLLPAHL